MARVVEKGVCVLLRPMAEEDNEKGYVSAQFKLG